MREDILTKETAGGFLDALYCRTMSKDYGADIEYKDRKGKTWTWNNSSKMKFGDKEGKQRGEITKITDRTKKMLDLAGELVRHRYGRSGVVRQRSA
jgi:hypothetical protein